MSLYRWWKLRKARKRKALLNEFRRGKRHLEEARLSYQSACAMHAMDIGAVEDKMHWESGALARVTYCISRQQSLARRLGLPAEAAG